MIGREVGKRGHGVVLITLPLRESGDILTSRSRVISPVFVVGSLDRSRIPQGERIVDGKRLAIQY